MEKLKLFIAIGLCVALMMFPLAGMADNPLPNDDNADGHPWDDGDNSDNPDNPNDTLPDSKEAELNNGNDKSSQCSMRIVFVWKWYLLLIW